MIAYTVDEKHKPPAHPFYGDSWERGLDPWHSDAFPEQFKYVGTTGERKGGWFLIDGYGNEIGFIQDGKYNDKGEPMELTQEHYRVAKIAYDAYSKQAGGVSLATGDKLPEFDSLKGSIKDGWAAVGIAVHLDADRVARLKNS